MVLDEFNNLKSSESPESDKLQNLWPASRLRDQLIGRRMLESQFRSSDAIRQSHTVSLEVLI